MGLPPAPWMLHKCDHGDPTLAILLFCEGSGAFLCAVHQNFMAPSSHLHVPFLPSSPVRVSSLCWQVTCLGRVRLRGGACSRSGTRGHCPRSITMSGGIAMRPRRFDCTGGTCSVAQKLLAWVMRDADRWIRGACGQKKAWHAGTEVGRAGKGRDRSRFSPGAPCVYGLHRYGVSPCLPEGR
jgi:hypothetical protein